MRTLTPDLPAEQVTFTEVAIQPDFLASFWTPDRGPMRMKVHLLTGAPYGTVGTTTDRYLL